MIYLKALLLIAVLFLAITFGIENSGSVTLRYYFRLASIPVPLYLVIYVAIILGIVAGLAIDVYSRLALRGRLKKLEKTNASLREDLEKMEAETAKRVTEESETRPTEPGTKQTRVLPSPPPKPENETEPETESSASEPGQN